MSSTSIANMVLFGQLIAKALKGGSVHIQILARGGAYTLANNPSLFLLHGALALWGLGLFIASAYFYCQGMYKGNMRYFRLPNGARWIVILYGSLQLAVWLWAARLGLYSTYPLTEWVAIAVPIVLLWSVIRGNTPETRHKIVVNTVWFTMQVMLFAWNIVFFLDFLPFAGPDPIGRIFGHIA